MKKVSYKDTTSKVYLQRSSNDDACLLIDTSVAALIPTSQHILTNYTLILVTLPSSRRYYIFAISTSSIIMNISAIAIISCSLAIFISCTSTSYAAAAATTTSSSVQRKRSVQNKHISTKQVEKLYNPHLGIIDNDTKPNRQLQSSMSISMSMDLKEEIEEEITEYYSTPSCSIESDLCICKGSCPEFIKSWEDHNTSITISLGAVSQLVYQPRLGIQLVSILEISL